MRTVLIVAALVSALVGAALGFELIHVDGDPHTLGWASWSFALFLASLLVADR